MGRRPGRGGGPERLPTGSRPFAVKCFGKLRAGDPIALQRQDIVLRIADFICFGLQQKKNAGIHAIILKLCFRDDAPPQRKPDLLIVTVHAADVFRVRPERHGFSRRAGTANHRAAPATQSR